MALTEPGHFGEPDVVHFSEVSYLDLPTQAHHLGFHGYQLGEIGDAEAGVAIATREPHHQLQPIIGSRAVPGVRERPILGVREYGIPFWAIHGPPGRTPIARAIYAGRARARTGVVGGDWNYSVQEMQRFAIGRTYRGIGVVGALIPKGLSPSRAYPVDIDSDHPGVDILLHL